MFRLFLIGLLATAAAVAAIYYGGQLLPERKPEQVLVLVVDEDLSRGARVLRRNSFKLAYKPLRELSDRAFLADPEKLTSDIDQLETVAALRAQEEPELPPVLEAEALDGLNKKVERLGHGMEVSSDLEAGDILLRGDLREYVPPPVIPTFYVVRLSRSVASGDPIGFDDFSLPKWDEHMSYDVLAVSQPDREGVAEFLSGLRSRRDLHSGDTLTLRDLEADPIEIEIEVPVIVEVEPEKKEPEKEPGFTRIRVPLADITHLLVEEAETFDLETFKPFDGVVSATGAMDATPVRVARLLEGIELDPEGRVEAEEDGDEDYWVLRLADEDARIWKDAHLAQDRGLLKVEYAPTGLAISHSNRRSCFEDTCITYRPADYFEQDEADQPVQVMGEQEDPAAGGLAPGPLLQDQLLLYPDMLNPDILNPFKFDPLAHEPFDQRQSRRSGGAQEVPHRDLYHEDLYHEDLGPAGPGHGGFDEVPQGAVRGN